MTTSESISQLLLEVPSLHRGPGGAVAVLRDGELVGQQVWGYADLEQRVPMTADTIMPICSITKQMLCGLLTDLERTPTPAMAAHQDAPAKQMSDQLARLLKPELLRDTGLTLRHLCHNQSGIRDYWALTVLWGARPEGHFSIADHGPQMLERLRSLHFAPGTEYSYANTNFFILARVIEAVTQQPLGELLEQRIFTPAGMTTASLCAHAAEHPPPCVGYEGDENQGFYPAVNCIEWAGDAGVVASLADMVAYEQFIDRSRDDSHAWYRANAARQTYKDGSAADYGHGLGYDEIGGVATLRHGGALRGYRLHRLYAPEPRISVVVLLNQEHGDAGAAAAHVLKKMLKLPETKNVHVTPGPDWIGCFLDPESQLAITINKGGEGEILLRYHRAVDKMRTVEEYRAQAEGLVATLEGDLLQLHVAKDNRKIQAQRVAKSKLPIEDSGIQGDYRCDEIDSVFHCSGQGGMLYGSFDGFLGSGPVHLMRCLAQDVWALACPRGMDATPPGDWTVVVRRDESGGVAGVTLGCWLARRLEFEKTSRAEV